MSRTVLGVCLLHSLVHDINVLARCVAGLKELQPLLHLLAQLSAKHRGEIVTEAVDARRDRTLVGKVAVQAQDRVIPNIKKQ